MTTLFVVPAERHVERLAREGLRAETRASLKERLGAALLPELRFADDREARLAMAVALEEARARAGERQLGLFAGTEDPILATLRGRGGASWVRSVAAIDEAVGQLRARGIGAEVLEKIRGTSVAARRARTLAAAMRALDETLGARGAVDGRLRAALLAAALRRAEPAALAELLGARHVRARFVLDWEPTELALFRGLDDALAVLGGDARVMLPSFEQRLSGSRERDPLEVLADAVAQRLDAAPETEPLVPVLGDLASTPPEAEAARHVRVVATASPRAEALAVAGLVRAALDGGVPLERVVVAYPVRDEKTLAPLRAALDAEGIVHHDGRGVPPTSAPVVATALLALEAAASLDRGPVARLLRSGYLDGPRVLADRGAEAPGFREAERTLERLARALETRATRAGEDAAARLRRTAAAEPDDEPAAARVVAILAAGAEARTRGDRARAARALFEALGLGSRAGRGALATFARDEAPRGVDRAERLALARDVRAWERMTAALDLYEATVSASTIAVDAEVFRLELAELLERAAPLPSAARAGAIRIARLGELAGDELDLLVVLDANDGVLPRDAPPISLLSDALEESIGKVLRDRHATRSAGERAARDLGALAMAAAAASSVVLVTTAEDATGTPAEPARVVQAVTRSRPVEVPAAGPRGLVVDAGAVLLRPGEIARRLERERAREGFFLDPARPLSDVVGALPARDATVALLTGETGPALERALAVTSLERIAQCPFRGFAHVVLAAREGEEQRELPDAREEGNLGHAALAAAFVAVGALWAARPRDAEAILRAGLAAAETALAENEGHAPLRAIVRLRLRESVRALLLRAIADEGWDFFAAEQAFGRREGWPAHGIEAGAEALWLRGSIDRVDQAHGCAQARVVDYKRGKATAKSAMGALGETALQIPVYAAVAARRLAMPATGTYLPMQPRDLASEGPPKPGKAEERVLELATPSARGALAPIEERALDLARAFRRGRLAPLPAKESDCTLCSVSGGCRKPRFAMAPEEEKEEKDA